MISKYKLGYYSPKVVGTRRERKVGSQKPTNKYIQLIILFPKLEAHATQIIYDLYTWRACSINYLIDIRNHVLCEETYFRLFGKMQKDFKPLVTMELLRQQYFDYRTTYLSQYRIEKVLLIWLNHTLP